MKDGVGKWVNLMSAVIAFVARSFGYLVMLGNFVADFTMNTFGIAIIEQPFKAFIVAGKFLLKVFTCVFHFDISKSQLQYEYSRLFTWCQGIVTFEKGGTASPFEKGRLRKEERPLPLKGRLRKREQPLPSNKGDCERGKSLSFENGD